jgi:hypothetical protein
MTAGASPSSGAPSMSGPGCGSPHLVKPVSAFVMARIAAITLHKPPGVLALRTPALRPNSKTLPAVDTPARHNLRQPHGPGQFHRCTPATRKHNITRTRHNGHKQKPRRPADVAGVGHDRGVTNPVPGPRVRRIADDDLEDDWATADLAARIVSATPSDLAIALRVIAGRLAVKAEQTAEPMFVLSDVAHVLESLHATSRVVLEKFDQLADNDSLLALGHLEGAIDSLGEIAHNF